jgi:hypothetical protein
MATVLGHHDILPHDIAPQDALPGRAKPLKDALRDGDPVTDVRPVKRISAALTSRFLCAGVLVAVALAARMVLANQSYDIFVDETTYTNIAQNVAAGHGVTLYGQPFDVHPPFMFLVYGAAIALLHIHGTVLQTLFALRRISEVLGALTPAVLFVMLDRFRSRLVAFFAALVVAMDPFALLNDTRVMLEPLAQLMMAATFAVIVTALFAPSRSARQRWLVGLAGVLAGATICSKETFGLVLLGSLAVMFVTGWVLARRQVAWMLGTMLAGAGAGVIVSVRGHGLANWFDTKVTDFDRLVGASQQTGFNAPGMHVTFLQRTLADLHEFWPSYIVLVVGSVAALLIVLNLRPWSAGKGGRAPLKAQDKAALALAIWTICAAGYLTYAMAFGSLEEQMYYIVLAPAACSLVAWCSMVGASAQLFKRWAAMLVLVWSDRHGQPYSSQVSIPRFLTSLLLVIVVSGDCAVWAGTHSRPDDEYASFLAWEASHLPNGAVVSATEDIAQFLMTGVVIGDWESVAQLKANHVDYLLLSTSLVQQGYTIGPPQFFAYVSAHSKLVYQVAGPSDGALQLWDVRAITGASLPAGATTPAPPALGPAKHVAAGPASTR